MRLGPLFWKLFAVTTAALLVAIGLCVWLIRSDFEQARLTPRVLFIVAVAALSASAVMSAGLAIWWNRRIRLLTAAAREWSRGNLSVRAPTLGTDEPGQLARALNRMRDGFVRQLDTITRQRSELLLLLGQLHEGVIVAGPNAEIVLVNPSAAKLLGITEVEYGAPGARRTVEQCVGQLDLQRMLLPSVYDAPARPAVEALSAAGAIHEARIDWPGANGELSLLARASDIALADAPAGAVKPGAAVGRLLVLTDITELTRAIRMKTDFVANASHELRTPLSAIKAAVETVIGMDEPRDADAGRFLDIIRRHCERLERLVSDLLDLSRVEAGQGGFKPALLKVASICDGLEKRWRDAIDAKGVAWRREIEPGCEHVFANAHLLDLILDNLVDNAIKFTDRGGEIRVAWRRDDRAVTVEIIDTGCGIPLRDQSRVFERFYQVQRARTGTGSAETPPRGTGLGLSIVRHAVAAMNGEVTVQSTLDKGTRMTVTIPQDTRGAVRAPSTEA